MVAGGKLWHRSRSTFAARNLHHTRDPTGCIKVSSIVSRIIGGNIIEGINHRSVRNGNEKKQVKKTADIPAVSEKRQKKKKVKRLGGGNHGTQYKSNISISNNTPIFIAYAINQLRPEPERGRPLSRASRNRLSTSELSAPVLRRPLAPRLGLPIRLSALGVGSFD